MQIENSRRYIRNGKYSRGNVDLVIGLEKEKPIYKRNDIEDGKFEMIVPRNGEYRITVKAKHNVGSIAIIKKQCIDEK